jgi:hypothetical protein
VALHGPGAPRGDGGEASRDGIEALCRDDAVAAGLLEKIGNVSLARAGIPMLFRASPIQKHSEEAIAEHCTNGYERGL